MPALGFYRFKVQSQSVPSMFYDVTFLDVCGCTCAYHLNAHGDCKHIMAVQMQVMDVPKLEPVSYDIKIPDPTCPEKDCQSTHYKYCDSRVRKTDGGTSIRYRCLKCRNRFTFSPGFLGWHYSEGNHMWKKHGKTPAEHMGITVRGRNAWITFMAFAATHC